MTMKSVVSSPIVVEQEHRLFFSRDIFKPTNHTLCKALLTGKEIGPLSVLVFWDAGLASAFPAITANIIGWFAAHSDKLHLSAPPIKLAGGEPAKNDFAELQSLWSSIDAAKLCRHSCIIAIGGGAVLDLVGFAAATAHRGIPLLRVPTTSLSQADGGVGVKNGVNYFSKKNWLGAFSVPRAIVNDAAFLEKLPPRERRAGLIEAVKVALIRDRDFYHTLASQAAALATFTAEPYEAAIRECAIQHFTHIASAGDPFERGSARPLDFGHWAAHKLEQLSNFQLTHGEAVALGMSLDLVYARRIGLLPAETCESILQVIATLGFAQSHPLFADPKPLLAGLEEFREHLGGRLTIPLIRAPGERVDVHEMNHAEVEGALAELRRDR